MRIEILDQASDDLIEGFDFYEAQGVGLGSYFLSNLYTDIESLRLYPGVHERTYKDYFRLFVPPVSLRCLLRRDCGHCLHSRRR